MLLRVALLHLAKELVPSFSMIWPAPETRPESLTVPTEGSVFTTVYILKMLVLCVAETVS
jgi:hypothetical protein